MTPTTDPKELFQQPAQMFLSREQLCARWNCSGSTLKRREKDGGLVPTLLGPRLVRYSMKMIEEIEKSR